MDCQLFLARMVGHVILVLDDQVMSVLIAGCLMRLFGNATGHGIRIRNYSINAGISMYCGFL